MPDNPKIIGCNYQIITVFTEKQKLYTSSTELIYSFLVGEDGFKPSKSLTTDLQSAPFGHSGIPPYHMKLYSLIAGAGRRTRTPDLLITNQLLYQLSYTSVSNEHGYYSEERVDCQALFHLFSDKRAKDFFFFHPRGVSWRQYVPQQRPGFPFRGAVSEAEWQTAALFADFRR